MSAGGPSARVVSDLDFLRGAAAIAVLLSHVVPAVVADRIEAGGCSPGHWVFYGAAAFGRVSVLMFFVLSGYLVARSTQNAPFIGRWRRYAIARASRILTVFWPALLLGVALDLLGMRLFGHVGIYAGHHPAHMFSTDVADRLTPGVFAANALFLPRLQSPVLGSNVALWSLSYEVWFYVAFPFVVVAAERRTRLGAAGALLTLVTIGAAVGPMLASYFAFWLVGVAVAWVERNRGVHFGRPARIGAAVVALLLSVAHMRMPGEWLRDGVVVAAFGVLIATMVLREEAPARSELFARIARALAGVSYSLYLVHVPLVVLLATALGAPPRALPSLRAFRNVGLIVGAIVPYVIFVWWLIERRAKAVRASLERMLGPKPIAVAQADGSSTA